MRFSTWGLLLSTLFAFGCSEITPEFQLPNIKNAQEKGRLKPSCGFKSVGNCYQRTIQLLTSCASGIGSKGELTKTFATCTNEDKDMFIEFKTLNPKNLSHMEFNFLDVDDNPCINFKGGPESFSIAGPSGELKMRKQGSNVVVTCLEGKKESKMTIPVDAYQYGCKNLSGEIDSYLPGIEVSRFGKEGAQLTFVGLQKPVNVFRCAQK